MQGMWLIAGLGNPGNRYEQTRHNVGFMVLDCLVEKLGSPHWKSSGNREQTEIRFSSGRKALLVKPQTFMNRSGDALVDLLAFYKIEPAQLVVVHDDVDLPLGSLKLKLGGGDGGHNGLKSVAGRLGTTEFIRLRFGVGRPNPEDKAYQELSDWVLARFAVAEEPLVDQVVQRALQALELVVSEDFKNAQNKVNRES